MKLKMFLLIQRNVIFTIKEVIQREIRVEEEKNIMNKVILEEDFLLEDFLLDLDEKIFNLKNCNFRIH
jgi:hypothetical protein